MAGVESKIYDNVNMKSNACPSWRPQKSSFKLFSYFRIANLITAYFKLFYNPKSSTSFDSHSSYIDLEFNFALIIINQVFYW